MDSGANRNVTNDKTIIRNYIDISPIPVYGVEKNEVACEIIGRGVTELMTNDGSIMLVPMYYAPGCAGTIISPNAIVRDNNQFTGWTQTSHLDTGKAYINFFHRSDFNQNKTIEMRMQNDLWFIDQTYLPLVANANRTTMCLLHEYEDPNIVHVHVLNKITEYELWHQRLMHPGHKCLDHIHSCTNGIPKLT